MAQTSGGSVFGLMCRGCEKVCACACSGIWACGCFGVDKCVLRVCVFVFVVVYVYVV